MTTTQLIKSIASLPERMDYHPEGLTGRHVALVMLKALISTGNRDIVIAALVHDLLKAQEGEMSEEHGGWSNPFHPVLATEWLETTNGNTLLYNLGAKDKTLIKNLVRHHMKNKDGKVAKSCKHIPFIDIFAWCDDMVNRWEMDFTRNLYLPTSDERRDGIFVDAHITYCNIAPIDREVGRNDRFTLTVNRFPHTYRFDQIPDFFVNQWSDFVPYLNLLLYKEIS